MSRKLYESKLPVEIQERIRNIEGIYKIANVKLTPVNKSYPLVSSESPRSEIYLPSDSVLNFANAILEAKVKFNHRGNSAAGSANNYVQSVYPPRYALASLIEELNVYINGVSVSSTKRYSYIYNWIKDWLNTFDVEVDNGLNEVNDPSILYQKPTGGTMSGYIVPRRGFPPSNRTGTDAGQDDINCRMEDTYHLNLGDSIGFFGEASSKILNTAILGEVKLEIVWTSQIASCILGGSVATGVPIYPSDAFTINSQMESASAIDTAANIETGQSVFERRRFIYYNNTNGYSLGDAGVPTAGNLNTTTYEAPQTAAAVAADTNNVYQISNIVLHIEAYQFRGGDYFDVMNALVGSGNYKYHFKRYVLQTDSATTNRIIDYRLVVNSECLNYVLATFRPSGYDTLSQVVNTLVSPTASGHAGVANTTWLEQVRSGLPFTFNQSKFFLRNGQRISKMQWRVDEVTMEGRTKREMYIDNLRHWRNYIPGVDSKPHAGLKNINDFENCYFTGILSFEVKSDDEVKYVYPLRGLNTNGKAIAISCTTEPETNTFAGQDTATNANGFSTINLDPANAAIPTFLICTTCCLNLNGVRNVDIKY